MDAEVEVNDCNLSSPWQGGNPVHELLTRRKIRPVLHPHIHQRMYCLHTIGLSWNISNNLSTCRYVVQKWKYMYVLYLYILYHKYISTNMLLWFFYLACYHCQRKYKSITHMASVGGSKFPIFWSILSISAFKKFCLVHSPGSVTHMYRCETCCRSTKQAHSEMLSASGQVCFCRTRWSPLGGLLMKHAVASRVSSEPHTRYRVRARAATCGGKRLDSCRILFYRAEHHISLRHNGTRLTTMRCPFLAL